MCGHDNPPGYAFCGVCGEALNHPQCRCGFTGQAHDLFCGRCGASLEDQASTGDASMNGTMAADVPRYDLQEMLASLNFDTTEVSASPTHVNQDEIEQLFKLQQDDSDT